MTQEIEATFIHIQPDAIRKKLGQLGATLVFPERLMRREVFDFDGFSLGKSGAWVRVRDEGDKITVTFKRVSGSGINDVEEIEFTSNSFEDACRLLQAVGLRKKAYQETKREEWILHQVQITIDTWPGLNPFMEIEGDREEDVKMVAQKLDMKYSEAIFGTVDTVYYKELGIPPEVINHQTPVLTFQDPPQKYVKE